MIERGVIQKPFFRWGLGRYCRKPYVLNLLRLEINQQLRARPLLHSLRDRYRRCAINRYGHSAREPYTEERYNIEGLIRYAHVHRFVYFQPLVAEQRRYCASSIRQFCVGQAYVARRQSDRRTKLATCIVESVS